MRPFQTAQRWFAVVLVLAALAGMNATAAVMLPPVDGDLGWQRWLGTQILHGGLPHALGAESFAAAGSHWIPQEWLFCALLMLAATHGLSALFALAVGACTVLALGCVAARSARYGAQPVAIAFVLIFVDVAMMPSFGVRVQVVGWALLAAFLLALELPAGQRWTAIVVAAVWADWHASAVLAPALAACAAAGSALERDRVAALRDALLTVGCAAAVCATPLGTALPLYALTLARSPIRHWINEWQRTSFTDPGFLMGVLPVLVLAALAAARAPRRSLAIAVPFSYLAFAATRNVPLAAIAFAPFAAVALSRLIPSLASLGARASRTAALVAPALAFTVLAAATATAAQRAHDTRPLRAITELARLPGAHRLLCEDFAWCGPALETGRIAVFLDGRADPFPLAVWREYDAVIHVRPQWRSILRRHDVNALLVARGERLDRAARTAGWRIATDAPIRLLLRPDSAGVRAVTARSERRRPQRVTGSRMLPA